MSRPESHLRSVPRRRERPPESDHATDGVQHHHGLLPALEAQLDEALDAVGRAARRQLSADGGSVWVALKIVALEKITQK